MEVDQVKCVGCGVCVPFCEDKAMILVRRPEEEIEYVPVTEKEWGETRQSAR